MCHFADKVSCLTSSLVFSCEYLKTTARGIDE